ncbi:HECT-domain (ubiquitin-transferase) family protein [Leishmania donovani]|uniref:HECT-domain (Ubiquitin-transferase) family protein n=1 Tax=Leishmania donovani TaxID=5661 RepID=A0A504XID5_LEIDO|nr:HECT-domain (ubiquitin-transferase) family protein [Leishmania donovani]
MSFAGIDNWIGPLPGLRSTPPLQITLLGDTATATSAGDTVPARSTTYEAQYVECAPYQKGTMCIQDPGGESKGAMELDTVPLSQLYATGYRMYRKKHQPDSKQSFTLPTSPPDFDGDAPIDPQTVARHVRSLANAYNSVTPTPPPFLIYEQVILDAQDALKMTTEESNQSTVLRNDEARNSPALHTADNSIGDLFVNSSTFGSQLQSDALMMSVSLLNGMQAHVRSLQLLYQRLLSDANLSRALAPSVVKELLTQLDISVREATPPSAQVMERCSIAGLLVGRRHQLDEVLRYADILEHLTITSASIVPVAVPHAREIVQSFSLHAADICPITSPIDCFQDEPIKMKMVLGEGTGVQRFCVSPNQQYLATVGSQKVMMLNLSTGSLHAERELPEVVSGCWNATFSEDSTHLICTDASGLRHAVLTTDLATKEDRTTDCVSLVTDYHKGVLETTPSPLLPSGSAASLHMLEANAKAYTASFSRPFPDSVDCFSLCAHVYNDCAGTLIHIVPDTGESLSVEVSGNLLRLRQGSSVCRGVLPSTSQWYFLHAHWCRGVWAVSVNFSIVELSGPHYTQSQTMKIKMVECLRCTGHFGSMALWSGLNGPATVRRFFQERLVDSSVSPLFVLPMDEGTGMWLKETVGRQCLSLNTKSFTWDSSVVVPVATTNLSAVPLDDRALLSGRVLKSAYRLFVMLPPAEKGSDDLVAEVDRESNRIVRVYQCPRSCSENAYAILGDESELLVYQQRFSTFSSVRLFTRRRMEKELALCNPSEACPCVGSAPWLLQEIYRRIYTESYELERVLPENSPLSFCTLSSLAQALRLVKSSTPPLKVLAFMSLTLVHFRRLATLNDTRISDIAASLKASCSTIMELFTEKAFLEVTLKLYRVATAWSLTVEDQAEMLLHMDSGEQASLQWSYFSRERVHTVIRHIVQHRPEYIVSAARNLLHQCEREAVSDPGEPKSATHLMTSFVLAVMTTLHTHAAGKSQAYASQLLELFVDYMFRCKSLFIPARVDEQPNSVLLTGVLPLLVTVANVCPAAVSAVTQEHLLELCDRLRAVQTSPEQVVGFSTREAYDMYVPNKEDNGIWRLCLDFSTARSVSLIKEASSPPVFVVQSDAQNGKPDNTVMDESSSFKKLDGGVLHIHGRGENSFTAIAQYEFLLDVSLASVMREAILRVLLAAAAELMQKPPTSSEIVIAPLFRYGLTTSVLTAHNVHTHGVPHENIFDFPLRVLEDRDEGKEFVDEVSKAMRGSILPSMRPAIRALLSILLHCGLTRGQAEDELKLRWFSGEWSTKLQGTTKTQTIVFLTSLARWMMECVFFEGDGATPMCGRRTSVRLENSLNGSRSLSERRGSTSSRRSVVKLSSQNDSLEQVRVLLAKGITPLMIQEDLISRARAAQNIEKGLRLLSRLLQIDPANLTEDFLTRALRVLYAFTCTDNCQHFTEVLCGAGVDAETAVRRAFHGALHSFFAVLKSSSSTVGYRAALTQKAFQGRALMLFHAILCLPWDEADCEEFKRSFETDNDILKFLESQMGSPTALAALTSPWRLRHEASRPAEDVTADQEQAVRTELLGAADFTSLSRVFPNDFSVVIPTIQTARSQFGVVMEKGSGAAVLVRADEGWQLNWKEGVPRVYYYEVKINSPINKFDVGVQLPRTELAVRGEDLFLSYSSLGDVHWGEQAQLPPFTEGDTVGCGIVATSRLLFYTLNGRFLSFAGRVNVPTNANADSALLYPVISFDDRSMVRVVVNFGIVPFAYDYRQLHPALTIEKGPTWYRITSTAEMVLHYLTARVCAVQESKSHSARGALTQVCDVVCRHVNSVTSSLMNIGIGGSSNSNSTTRVQQAVALTVAEYSIMVLISTIRHIATHGILLSEHISNMVFDAVSILMLLPLHSVQIATIGLLPDVIVHVKEVPDGKAAGNLVSTLFENANCATDSEDVIPFVPMWCECDASAMAIVNVQNAHMLQDAQRSIVLGNVLPRTGMVSFSVKVVRRNMSKGHSLKGGYFIGVSVAGLSPLTPTSNSQSWKAVNPPIVWAIQDTSPQLPHATNPTVKLNNFQRTFGNADVIRVVVDRDKRCIDFYREGEFLKTLFSNIPEDIDLVPFVQLYNDDAAAAISAGTMTAPITGPMLLGAASADVLRSMLTLDPFQCLVAQRLCEELSFQRFPKVTLLIFKSVPDPRLLQLRSSVGEEVTVTVSRLNDLRCKFTLGDKANYEHLYNMRTPAKPRTVCTFDIILPTSRLTGLSRCIDHLIAAAERMVVPRITVEALCCTEQDERCKIVLEEKDHWDFLFHGLRVGSFITVLRRLPSITAMHAPPIPHDYTFSAALSNPGFVLPSHYCGRLATVPTGAKGVSTPFIAIAEPAIPTGAKVSIRCQLIRGNQGQILGGGYYFGVCTPSFHWKHKDLNAHTGEVWALHDMDDSPWRLRHLRPDATFPVAAEPRCIIVSGDIIRLYIDRTARVMHAFRTPVNGDEVPLGLIFDNLPADGALYPFVNLFNTDAVAVFLPSNSTAPAIRLPCQKLPYALCTADERKACDGCNSNLGDARVSGRWFKCNECADYTLCSSCFLTCVHSNHSFTMMHGSPIAYSTTTPATVERGMEVTIPATSVMYLRSSGCRMHEAKMNCVAEAVEDNALCAWGLVSQDGSEPFSVVIDTVDGSPLSPDAPVLVGLGPAQEIVQSTRDKLRDKCLANIPTIATYCSDPSLRQPLENRSRDPYGFKRGSRITLKYDAAAGRITISRDWVVVGTKSVALKDSENAVQPIGCFVLLGKKGTTVSVFPERACTLTTTVEEVTGNILKTVGRDGSVWFVTRENCRLPLTPCRGLFQKSSLGYILMDHRLVQCRRQSWDNRLIRVQVLETEEVVSVPLHHYLINESSAISEEWFLCRRDRDEGATVEEGFERLLSMTKRLATVNIENDAPVDSLDEIRASVASTANRRRWALEKRHIAPFVPVLNTDERKRRFQNGTLVHTVDSDDVFEVTFRRGESLTVRNTRSEFVSKVSYRNCVPLKQCGGRAWYTRRNGLPCSLYEHTVRLSSPAKASESVPLQDEWLGEVVFARTAKSLTVSLSPHGIGRADIAQGTTEETRLIVVYEHKRYSRVVRLFMRLYSADLECKLEQLVTSSGEGSLTPTRDYQDLVDFLNRAAEPVHDRPVAPGQEMYFGMVGFLDAEGLRLKGVFHCHQGKGGTFTLNSCRRFALLSPVSEKWMVEPLPDCLDASIPPAPHRNMRECTHRLVVLLARHLYLVTCSQIERRPADFLDHIFFFTSHPLADTLVRKDAGTHQLSVMLSEVNIRITDPSVKPWDAISLARLATNSLLLRPEAIHNVREHLLWDCLHGVVTAAHRCGRYHRHEVLRSITAFVQTRLQHTSIYQQLFSTLFSYVERWVVALPEDREMKKDVAAGIDLLLALGSPLDEQMRKIPVAPLHCLIDLWRSVTAEVALPRVVDELHLAIDPESPPVGTLCTFGDYVRQELKVGKVTSTCGTAGKGHYYYEVTLPDRITSAYAIGWGTAVHNEVPGQHVGSDRNSFAYNGTDINTRDGKEEYKIPTESIPGAVVGCLLNMEERTAAWSLNGVVGHFISIPISFTSNTPLFAFASIGTCSGMKVRLRANEFEYAPDGYTDLSGRFARPVVDSYNRDQRSLMDRQPYAFYLHLASFLSDVEDYLDDQAAQNQTASLSQLPEDPYKLFVHAYPLLQSYPPSALQKFAQVIAVTESCMATANNFVDLDEETVTGTLSQAFLSMKGLVRRSFRQRLLVNVAPLEAVSTVPTIFVRVTDLYSTLPRTTESALRHSILAQLYRQIGFLTEEQWAVSPLFKVNLHISGSGHAPVDMGGPYRQLWTFLAFELMQHPDKCYPNSDFHRNPLFVFVNNSQRISLVPDSQANSIYDLNLFTFFGKIMGHSARAKTPLDIDFSPFFWKFLVDDELTIKDFYTHVDSVVEATVRDDNFLLSGVADELIPGFAESVEWLDSDDNDEVAAQQRRTIAERCLVHSMDEQLSAIRSGLWKTLSRRVVRCLSWRDLEHLVCGESNLTLQDLQRYIRVQLTGSREAHFWQIVEQLSMEQRASLICFASGQRRLPLIRPITVAENNESVDYLPRAQACGSLITIPQYTSLEMFKEKLLMALQHQMEMELA